MSRNYAINRAASAAIAAFRVVRLTADNTVAQSAAAADAHLGVCSQPGGAAVNARCDLIVSGIAEAEAGGTIARGDLLTADAQGRVITATAAAGVNVRVIGMALVSAVVGDVVEIFINQGSFQG